MGVLEIGSVKLGPVDEPAKLYRLTTAHGSVFTAVFKPTHRGPAADGTVICQGDMVIRGYAKSVDRYIAFSGIAFEPDVGESLTVAPYTMKEDGTEERDWEIITSIEELPDITGGP